MFKDRNDAGKKLGQLLGDLKADFVNPLILALPRGGIPLAAAISDQMGWDWDIWLVRKVASGDNPEFALGALAEGGAVFWNEGAIGRIDNQHLADAEQRAYRELGLYGKRFRRHGHSPDVAGRDIIVVDDGLATGLSAIATSLALHKAGAGRVYGAFPVAPQGAREDLGRYFDDLFILHTSEKFLFLSDFYEDFYPVSDSDAVRLLDKRRSQ